MNPNTALKLLARALLAGYTGLVIYVSLVPFEGWDFSDLASMPPFWRRPIENYWTIADLIFNIVAYIPLSILAFFSLRTNRIMRFMLPLVFTCALSFSMEYLQEGLPSRVASWLDWGMNSLGGLIGLWLVRVIRKNAWILTHFIRFYSYVFRLNPAAVAGQAVLGLWSLAHINPALAPFGLIYQQPIPSEDVIRVWIEAVQIAFECVGIGLFFSLLLRPHKLAPLALFLFLLSTLAMKYIGASALFHAETSVIHAHQWLGLGIGVAWLAILIWLPLSLTRIASGIAIASSIGVTFLGRDLLKTNIPFDLFDWSYGQLVHFNQLTFATIWATTAWIISHLALLGETTIPPQARLTQKEDL